MLLLDNANFSKKNFNLQFPKVAILTCVRLPLHVSNAPGYQLGQRSRIGDAILLFDSPELADKLKPYDKEHHFSVSKGFSVTLKGGMRGEGHQNFSLEMTSSVITNAAEQAMKSARDAHGQE